MKINTQTGLLSPCKHLPSPNKDARPGAQTLDLIVIHSISLPPGIYGGNAIEDFFTNQLDATAHPYFQEIHEMKVSSHILIKRDGDIVQFVPFTQRAWHAGVSNYKGREQCNDFSIGIELEGNDTEPFNNEQYINLAELIQTLTDTYATLSLDAITGHSDIAPGRKTDPGSGFDWRKLNKLLAQKP